MVFSILLKIMIYSSIFFLKLSFSIYHSIINVLYNTSTVLKSYLLIVLNLGEENLIINHLSEYKLPRHVAIVISKSHDIRYILKLISWTLYGNQTKYLTIYDPFDCYTGNEIKLRTLSLTAQSLFGEKILLNIQEEMKPKADALIVNIVNFTQANGDLIKEINHKGKFIPAPLNRIFPNTLDSENKVKYNKPYERFYTRKSDERLPELILINDKETSLYGFPFTLCENSEIQYF